MTKKILLYSFILGGLLMALLWKPCLEEYFFGPAREGKDSNCMVAAFVMVIPANLLGIPFLILSPIHRPTFDFIQKHIIFSPIILWISHVLSFWYLGFVLFAWFTVIFKIIKSIIGVFHKNPRSN